jgi:DNA polymerase III sliding clamp (beta) subunit (PCNA family)
MSQNTILLAPHHDITAFCSQDESRYALCGVHFNAEKKRLEATDGRMLIVVPVLQSDGEYPTPITQGKEEPKDFLIHAKFLQEALEKIPQRTTLPILKKAQVDTSLNDNGKEIKRINISTTDLDCEYVTSSKDMQTPFPNAEQVFPKDPPNWHITLSPRLLAAIGNYANKHCNDKASSVKIEFWTEHDPARFTMLVGEEQQQAIVILMPMRMS